VAWYDGRLSPKPRAGGTGGNETGFQDVYATSSTDQGVTFGPNLRITDRSIDRSVGVWSNNIDSNHAVGVTSTDDSVYFAWQDSRESDREAQAEAFTWPRSRWRVPRPLRRRTTASPRGRS
jgi:hypothetical protein